MSNACHQHTDPGLGLLLAAGQGQLRGPDVFRVCQGSPGKPDSRLWCSMLRRGFISGNWFTWLSLAGESQLCRVGHWAEDPGASRRRDPSLLTAPPFSEEVGLLCCVRSFN